MSAPAEPYGQLLGALRRLRTAIAVRDRAVAGALHLRESDLSVLELLHREGQQSPTVLAARTRTHAATMTGILARLERGGWIVRVPTEGDRRSVRIIGTSVERFMMLYAADTERLERVFRGWAPNHAEAFLRSVEEIAEALETA
ncbi:MarR family winged helix-turn-helix transcriptional regulator [Leucobacter komagatae]|uniref:MarR family winged helix-turn-helix transcriptional regulator n=1 Tax=Leucobacter komagatae TaxID=55969 RepID=UPI0006985C6E|nr:MarR family transcriptional regulator [Leucobacter komagatae]